jgi:hypothetical protein
MRILFKFPIRERKVKFFQTLDLYYNLIGNKNDFSFLITIDADDKMLNNPSVLQELKEYPKLIFAVTDCHSKIEAVNYGINEHDWDILVVVSDDMIPKVKGFDNIIRDKMAELYPDLDGALWFNDGNQEDRCNTLQIMGRKYYDRFGYVYHPSYLSLRCDVEYQDIAKRLNRITYFPEVIIRHEHADFGIIPYDKLYRHNNSLFRQDADNFIKREALGFPVGIPKIAHFIWSAGTPLSYLRWLSYYTFKQLHPDWQIMFHLVSGCSTTKTWIGTEELEFMTYTGKDYLSFVDGIVMHEVDGILPNYASDLIRWQSLYQHGGYYFDLDQLFIKSFNPLLDYDIVWGGTKINYSGVVGMFKRCPLAKEMADMVQSRLAAATSYCEVGNWLWSDRIGQGTDYKEFCTPMNYFYPVPRSEQMKRYFNGKKPDLSDSYAIHWFGGHPDSQEFNRRSVERINKTLGRWQG